MAETLSNVTGDGVTVNFISAIINIGDTSASNVAFAGVVQVPGNPKVALTGSPIAMPAVPGSGNVFWQLMANYLTGAVTLVQSTSAFQAAGANQIEIFRQTLPAGTTIPSVQCQDVTPDSW